MSNIRNWQWFHDSVWDWTPLNQCFGDTKIRFEDADGIVERKGHFLILEGKRLEEGQVPGKLPLGQQLLHNALCSLGVFTVVVLWGSPPRGPIRYLRVQDKQGIGKIVPASMDDLQAIVTEWFRAADGAPEGGEAA